jgi:hypothetical protein
MARLLGLAALLVAALLLAATPAAARTRVVQFTPFTKAGEPKKRFKAVRRTDTCCSAPGWPCATTLDAAAPGGGAAIHASTTPSSRTPWGA